MTPTRSAAPATQPPTSKPPVGPAVSVRPRGGQLRVPALLKARRATVPQLLFRAPILLYRLGLGWLLGHQFRLLMHAGRRTGRVHDTVLKVLRYEPGTGESIVAAAWGKEADWYRNIQAHPALAVWTGGDRYVPAQRLLPPDEAFDVFEDWTRRQRRFATLMLGQIGHAIDGPEAERRALVARFPFIGLRPERRLGRHTGGPR